ncbi:MAG: hypothetical protein DMG65_18420 [Candidatus Angelobacter sp. Gp1-AA117]|nr:MAG: hypothetical protein DMG65_18420 [Candidatus Angelobacter sp. Gp1-AA117]
MTGALLHETAVLWPSCWRGNSPQSTQRTRRNQRELCHTIVAYMKKSCILLFLFLGMPIVLTAQSNEQLGKISFPVSCSSEVQPAFERGVALLHSFQYATAEAAFAEVAKKDPQCAMAYWGQAMSLYHQLWGWPKTAEMSKGHDLMEKADKLAPKDERERLYIRAASEFFKSKQGLEKSDRVKAYSNSMAKLHKKYPGDVEATTFYALSLISGYRKNKDSGKAQTEAVAILKEVFAKNPDHPGAAHYLIHATDSPGLAPEGLEAARRYARVAPSSAHALHMPAHIFSRLGLWQDMIDSNVASAAAAAEATRNNVDNEASYQLHAMKYLQYAYEQTGRDADARQVIDDVKNVPGIKPEDITDDGSVMQALYALETHNWEAASRLSDSAPTVRFSRMRVLWARAIGAARLGNKDQAQKDMEKLRNEMNADHQDPATSPRALEAEAWIAFASGQSDEAVKKMHAAARLDEFGVDAASLPAAEMLADLLLELKRPAEALEAYEATLKDARNRFNSLYGAGRAAELAGKEDKARQYYATLIKVTAPQSDRPEIQQAKTYLAGTVTAEKQSTK